MPQREQVSVILAIVFSLFLGYTTTITPAGLADGERRVRRTRERRGEARGSRRRPRELGPVAVTECPVCAAENPDGFRFCGQCGASLAGTPPHAQERKVVTTLFCDLVGFTAMGEAADPEDVADVLRRYHRQARRVIESHGGVVEESVGDAVVAVFGVPTAHEDENGGA